MSEPFLTGVYDILNSFFTYPHTSAALPNKWVSNIPLSFSICSVDNLKNPPWWELEIRPSIPVSLYIFLYRRIVRSSRRRASSTWWSVHPFDIRIIALILSASRLPMQARCASSRINFSSSVKLKSSVPLFAIKSYTMNLC